MNESTLTDLQVEVLHSPQAVVQQAFAALARELNQAVSRAGVVVNGNNDAVSGDMVLFTSGMNLFKSGRVVVENLFGHGGRQWIASQPPALRTRGINLTERTQVPQKFLQLLGYFLRPLLPWQVISDAY